MPHTGLLVSESDVMSEAARLRYQVSTGEARPLGAGYDMMANRAYLPNDWSCSKLRAAEEA